MVKLYIPTDTPNKLFFSIPNVTFLSIQKAANLLMSSSLKSIFEGCERNNGGEWEKELEFFYL